MAFSCVISQAAAEGRLSLFILPKPYRPGKCILLMIDGSNERILLSKHDSGFLIAGLAEH